ncbi:hypothetical protein KNP414_03058 [Paenibacillus mucilaginosus KNP414]|uniref:Uncharacterized protein n=1 Tax=Paenibacillus mucilaginosus (strain KNP414) TaxID=1036673 RepID=F8F8M8_PAEMK|nr:hypothetical protein KNP414_03058 [Paenibacillus mucilaginosus KNP414]
MLQAKDKRTVGPHTQDPAFIFVSLFGRARDEGFFCASKKEGIIF